VLAAAPSGPQVSVLNNGIGGNRILNDGPATFESFEVKAVARFDRDVLALDRCDRRDPAREMNDIGFSVAIAPDEDMSAAEIIEGMRNLTTRAHAKGSSDLRRDATAVRGAGYYTQTEEAKRHAVNHCIRTSGDAVVDFDEAVRDPRTRCGSGPSTTTATTCTPVMPATRRWPKPSTSHCLGFTLGGGRRQRRTLAVCDLCAELNRTTP
jgi:hypothetical protein